MKRRALRVDGHSPKEIARALGLRPAAVTHLVRTIYCLGVKDALGPRVIT